MKTNMTTTQTAPTPKVACYHEIIFAQGASARLPLAILAEEGITAAVLYLAQWDTGRESEHSPGPSPWGSGDRIAERGDYVCSYNLHLGYIGLARIEREVV
jgi:hypothetical protein